jgi:hypothetical protein
MLKAKLLGLIVTLMLASMAAVRVGAQQATVELIPASYTVLNVGLTFSVNVTVHDVENLYGFEFKLFYPNDILNGTNVKEGVFLKTGGVYTWFYMAAFTDNYNATHGLLNLLCTRTGANGTGVDGAGTLATVTFKSVSANGPSKLGLTDVKLSDPDSNAIPYTALDGEITVLPEFSSIMILPIIMAFTITAIIMSKKTRN